ncbi:hypothetical protein LTR37_019047 [Vermiconidia calcicola]|uniref:Uncharacterized protein n=1 Tax=Vermiconidia calcicola TaxID=1690605 RepID=A0ACC3MF71_9PEZI|nr:hypothetical protein LTR37_019047 [Vermiconidia calcicola]
MELECDTALAGDASSHATTKVLGLPELLEHILLGLDFKTLLLSQRVSTTWNDLIGHTRSLQQKLFFLPVASVDEAVDLGMVDRESLLLVEYPSDTDEFGKHHAVINTSILTAKDRGPEWTTRFQIRAGVHIEIRSHREGLGSWERMYFSQPPVEPFLTCAYGRSLGPPAQTQSGPERGAGPSQGTVRRWMDDTEATLFESLGKRVPWHTQNVLISMKGLTYTYERLERGFFGRMKQFFGDKEEVQER